jgi:hypothetical protein
LSGIITYYYSSLLINSKLQKTLELIIKCISLCLIIIGVSDIKTFVVLIICIFTIYIISRLINRFFGKKKNKYLIQRPKSIKKKIGRLLGDNKALSINCIQNNVSLYSEDSISQYSEDSIGQYSEDSVSQYSDEILSKLSDNSNYEMSTVYSRPQYNIQIYSRKLISIEEYRIQTCNCTESKLHEMKFDFQNSFDKLKILKKLSDPYR